MVLIGPWLWSACGGGLPLGPLVVDAWDPAATSGYVLGAESGGASVFLVDREGAVAWSRFALPGHETEVVAVQGGAVYRDDHPPSALRGARILREEDGRTEVIEAPGLHHSFEVLSDGTLAWLELDVRETEAYGAVVGDALRVRDPDGAERILFSVWDVLDPAPNPWFRDGYYAFGADWTHANTVAWDAERRTWLVTLRNLGSVLEVDERGELVRVLEPGLERPHGARWTPSGTLLLLASDDEESWASELELGPDGGLREVWSHGRGEGWSAEGKGEARRLPDGHTLVNFGTAGVVREVDGLGAVVWEAHLAGEGYLGTTVRLDGVPEALER